MSFVGGYLNAMHTEHCRIFSPAETACTKEYGPYDKSLHKESITTFVINVSHLLRYIEVKYLPLKNKLLQKNIFFSIEKKNTNFSYRIIGISYRKKELPVGI